MRLPLACAIVLLSAVLAGPAVRAADIEVVAGNLQFPEGTIFVGDTLYFVDYVTSRVLRLAGGKVETVWQQNGCGANGLVQHGAGLLVACFDGGTLEQISLTGQGGGTIRRDDAGQKLVAPNDLAADARGGVYFTASGGPGTPGKVFYIDGQLRLKEVASDIRFANGLVVSRDGRQLYVAETPASRILVFTIRPDGGLSDRRDFARLGEVLAGGRTYGPDGVRMDKFGNLFLALYNGGGYAVLSPAGKRLAQIDLPATHHTNLAIAPDGKSIFITAVDDAPGGTYRGEIYRVANPVTQ